MPRLRRGGRRRAHFGVVLASVLVTAACGSGNTASPLKAVAPSSSGSAGTTARSGLSTGSTPSSTAPSAAGPRIGPGQAVGLRCDYGNNKTELYQVDLATEQVRLVKTVVPATAISGWGFEDYPLSCTRRAQWSADFTKVLFAGTPPGLQVSHIAYLDLTTNKVIDLTAARQQSGFSAKTLKEDAPLFTAQAGATLTFGSGTVQFTREQKTWTTSISNPSAESDTGQAADYTSRSHGHPEFDVNGFAAGQLLRQRTALNSSGTVMVSVTSSDSAALIGPDGTSVKIDCARGNQYLGWQDDNHLVTWQDSGLSGASLVIITVTVNPLGFSCGDNVAPKSDRQLHDARLRLDGSAVVFSAKGPQGDQLYQFSLKGGEPTATTKTNFPEDLEVFER